MAESKKAKPDIIKTKQKVYIKGLRAVGKYFGLSQVAVSKWIKNEGCPPAIKKGKYKGYYDILAIEQWRENQEEENQNKSYWDIEYRKKQIEKVEIQIEELKGKYIEKEVVEAENIKKFSIIRNELAILPRKLAPICEGQTRAFIEEELFKEINQILRNLSGLDANED